MLKSLIACVGSLVRTGPKSIHGARETTADQPDPSRRMVVLGGTALVAGALLVPGVFTTPADAHPHPRRRRRRRRRSARRRRRYRRHSHRRRYRRRRRRRYYSYYEPYYYRPYYYRPYYYRRPGVYFHFGY